jgi:hypothetical protein
MAVAAVLAMVVVFPLPRVATIAFKKKTKNVKKKKKKTCVCWSMFFF